MKINETLQNKKSFVFNLVTVVLAKFALNTFYNALV